MHTPFSFNLKSETASKRFGENISKCALRLFTNDGGQDNFFDKQTEN